MVRRYDPEQPVPAEALDTILRNATPRPERRLQPGLGLRGAHRTAEQREAFWAATTDPDDEPDAWLEGVQQRPGAGPVLLRRGAPTCDRYAEPDKGWTDMDEARWPVPYWDIDTGMAALLMLLTAVDEGLGGLFFGVPPESHEDVHEAFAHPARPRHRRRGRDRPPRCPPHPGSPSRRPRRPLSEVAHAGRFGTPYAPA